MKVLRYILVLLCVGCFTQLRAQDPNFSQFFMNEIYYNPALTGINNGLRVGTSYRNLWGPIPSKFNTGSVFMDGSGVNKMGLGLLASMDVEGEGKLRTTSIAGNYSYRMVETKNFRFQLGVQGQYIRKQVDWSQLVFSDQMDEVFGNVNSSSFIIPSQDITQYVDFGAGGALKFNAGGGKSGQNKTMTGTVGLAVLHLAQPKDAFIGGGEGYLPRKLVLHLDTKIISPGVIYAPAFIYEKQSNITTFQAGLNFSKLHMFAGAWFRNRSFTFSPKRFDSFIFNIGLAKKTKNNTKIKMGYSYDFTISRLQAASFGTHEISLIMEWSEKFLFQGRSNRQAHRTKYRFIPCTDY